MLRKLSVRLTQEFGKGFPETNLKYSYVLGFLGNSAACKFREADLEQAIINKPQAFMLELGKGYLWHELA